MPGTNGAGSGSNWEFNWGGAATGATVFGGMTEGQLAATSLFLRSTALPGVEAAIASLNKFLGPIGMGATVFNEVAQAVNDIQNDVPAGIAVTGAVINGTLTIGAGILATPLGPEASVGVGGTVGVMLPSNVTMGQAFWDQYQNWYNADFGM